MPTSRCKRHRAPLVRSPASQRCSTCSGVSSASGFMILPSPRATTSSSNTYSVRGRVEELQALFNSRYAIPHREITCTTAGFIDTLQLNVNMCFAVEETRPRKRTPQAYEFLAHTVATNHRPLAHGWSHRCRLSLYYGPAWQA